MTQKIKLARRDRRLLRMAVEKTMYPPMIYKDGRAQQAKSTLQQEVNHMENKAHYEKLIQLGLDTKANVDAIKNDLIPGGLTEIPNKKSWWQ